MSQITTNPINSSQETGVKTNIARSPETYVNRLLTAQFNEQKKIQNRKRYKGIVLYSKVVRKQEFVEKFDEDFVTYVLKSTDADAMAHISHVNETVVYIPEVSGTLPFPDMTAIEAGLSRVRGEMNNEEDEDWEKLSEKAKGKGWLEFEKAITRLDRFPRFYSAQQATNSSGDRASVQRDSTVMVEFLDDDDWSTSGVLLGSGAI